MVKDYTDCGDVRAEFSALLDGELTQDERDGVERHLGDCAECLRELHQMQRVNHLYGDLPRVTAPEGFEERIRAAVAPKRRWLPVPRFTLPAFHLPKVIPAPVYALAALFIVTIGVSLTFFRFTLDGGLGMDERMSVSQLERSQGLAEWEPSAAHVTESREEALSVPAQGIVGRFPGAQAGESEPTADADTESPPPPSTSLRAPTVELMAHDALPLSADDGDGLTTESFFADELAKADARPPMENAPDVAGRAGELADRATDNRALRGRAVGGSASQPAAVAEENPVRQSKLAQPSPAPPAAPQTVADALDEMNVGLRLRSIPEVRFYDYRDGELVRIKPLDVTRTPVTRDSKLYAELAKRDPGVAFYNLLSTRENYTIVFEVDGVWYEIAPAPKVD